MNIFFYIKELAKNPTPFKYLASRLLIRTGLCRFLTFKVNNYRLHFHPCSITADLWKNPNTRGYLLLNLISPGDIIIDIGANIGSTVIPSAIAAGPHGKVYAFEPNPRIYGYLAENIKLNNLDNVLPHNLALGSESGTGKISDYEEDDQNQVLNGNDDGIEVVIGKLDEFCQHEKNISYLKIDVEGFEKFVLEGASATLNNTACIFLEISEQMFNQYDYSVREVISLLEKKDFQIFRFPADKQIKQIDASYRPEKNYENIIALKEPEKFIREAGFQLI